MTLTVSGYLFSLKPEMKKYSLVALSFTGGILSGLAWAEWCSGLILLVSLVPFFLIENYFYENSIRYSSTAYFIYTLPGFLIFSIMVLGWIRAASIAAAICVIVGITFIMAFILWMGHLVRMRVGNLLSILAIISFWMGYEYLSLNLDLLSPWINLGNGLAKDIMFVQWYEVTGTSGGSLWILLSNILLTVMLVKSSSRRRISILYLIIWTAILILPSTLSLSRYYNIRDSNGKDSGILIVQPNYDPYEEKFRIPFEEQLKKVLAMIRSVSTEETCWVITPETTVDDPINESELNSNKYVNMVKALAFRNPQISFIMGMTTFKSDTSSIIPAKRSVKGIMIPDFNYKYFNSALKIDTGHTVSIYHKSKLVPGIEKQFSTWPGRLFARILPYMGGTQWGYGTQKERTCFVHPVSKLKVAPVICYESVFGKYVTDYVKNGANAIFIITNDGWWKNTDGYKQHLSYASLRAIETRRPVARAANTGISCIIDFKGRIITQTKWWTQGTVKGTISPGTELTPYVRYGDYLLQAGSFLSVLILLTVFVALPACRKIK